MAIKTEFKLVFDRFPEVRRKAPLQARAAVKKTTFDLEARAKAKAPVDTGALKNSIHSYFENDGFTGIVAPGVHYGVQPPRKCDLAS